MVPLRRLFATVALLLPLALSCNRSDEKKGPTIAVIPKGTTHEFWKAVHAGAVKASRELGVQVVWKGPLKEDDLKQQVDLVQTFTAQGVAGIVLAPLNDKALGAPVRAAKAANVPVVIFDSDLEGKEHVSFVATDNREAGKLAGAHLAKVIGKGKVLVLRYQEGSASTHNREEGFLEAARAGAGVEIVSHNRYGGATTESAHKASDDLLAAHQAAADGVQGIFCPNESTTFGMLLALEKANLAGKIKLVGFDASDKLVKALEAGKIEALVVQDPMKMGYLAVKTMAAHLKGEKVEPRIDTGAALVTLANMREPAVAELLKPDLAKWLGGSE